MNRRDFLKKAGVSAAALTAGSGMVKSNAFAMNSLAGATSDVSFVGSSASGSRRKMIADVLEPWRTKLTNGIANKTILIKVNMVFWNGGIPDPKLSLTHVDAVRGLLDFIRSINQSVQIIIGECAPALNLSKMWTDAGYTALTTEYSNVTLMDLNKTDTIPSVERHIWTPDFTTTTTIPISSAFVDPKYYVISICRPKTHNCMIITGVNKNILMSAPLNSWTVNGKTVSPKQYMHGKDGWYTGTQKNENKCLSYNLFQMANTIYLKGAPALAVLDAWEGMEGEGPMSGTSIMQYCAVASSDPLAVDRLMAKLMGFSDTANDPINTENPSYTDMRHLVWMSNAGLGNYDLSKINFILGSLSSLESYVKKYKLTVNYTGNPSYETNWTGGPPSTVLDPESIRDSRYLDPRPLLIPQLQKIITTNEIVIDFSLPVSYLVTVSIFNIKGKEIRRLGSEYLPGGRYKALWNRRDNNGSRVSAGQYIIKLGFGSRSMCDKVSLVD
jgi:uncharacterized protein (DUF362 family)